MEPRQMLTENQQKFLTVYEQRWDDPHNFCIDCFGITPWEEQTRMMRGVASNRRTSMKTCPAAGKSYGAAMVAWWFLMKFPPAIVITSAPTDRQVTKVLWHHMRSLYSQAYSRGFDFGGKMLPAKAEWRSGYANWFSLGFATDDTEMTQRFQGFHAPNFLIIFDEANGMSEAMYRSLEMLMTASGTKCLLIGNPIDPAGEFYKSFTNPNYNNITVTAYDTPNVIAGKDVIPGLVSPEWIEEREQAWGKKSPLFKSLVMAEFPTESEHALIPLSWVEQAIERWKHLDWKTVKGQEVCACDPGHKGNDPSAFVWRIGNVMTELERHDTMDTMEALGRLKIEHDKGILCGVDPIGIGAGMVDRAIEIDMDLVPIDFRYSTDETDISGTLKFRTMRDAMWWACREALDPEGRIRLCIPDDDKLKQDLTAPTWKITSAGVIIVESKDEIKKRIQRSTDTGDALAMTFALRSIGTAIQRMDAEEDNEKPEVAYQGIFGQGFSTISRGDGKGLRGGLMFQPGGQPPLETADKDDDDEPGGLREDYG